MAAFGWSVIGSRLLVGGSPFGYPRRMLQGERVLLRPPKREDTPVIHEYWSDLEMQSRASNRAPRPRTVEDTQTLLDDLEKRDDHVRFVIEVDGEIVGDCSLHDIDFHNRACEVGISLGRPHWGQGYGQDALRSLVDYAFRHYNMHRVALEVLADDPRAVGCYRKVGFVEEGRLRQRDWRDGEYHDVLVMGILDTEWS